MGSPPTPLPPQLRQARTPQATLDSPSQWPRIEVGPRRFQLPVPRPCRTEPPIAAPKGQRGRDQGESRRLRGTVNPSATVRVRRRPSPSSSTVLGLFPHLQTPRRSRCPNSGPFRGQLPGHPLGPLCCFPHRDSARQTPALLYGHGPGPRPGWPRACALPLRPLLPTSAEPPFP